MSQLQIKEGTHVETSVKTPLTIALQMKTFLRPEDDEAVMFTDCADVPYTVTFSDNKNFQVEERYGEV